MCFAGVMCFNAQGNVAVMNTNMEMLALLSKGGFFGELALLATARRTARVSLHMSYGTRIRRLFA